MKASRKVPLSARTARRATVQIITSCIESQPVKTYGEALLRLTDKQRVYMMARAEGDTQEQASQTAGIPDRSMGSRLEDYPAIAKAKRSVALAAIRGSMMSLRQRQDYVLDRLLTEAEGAHARDRLKSLELLGKASGLFNERDQGVGTNPDNAIDIKQRITTLLNSLSARDVTDDVTSNDAPCDDGNVTIDCVNDAESSESLLPEQGKQV